MNNWPTKKLGEICEENISGDWGAAEKKPNLILCKVIRGTDFVLVQKNELSKLPDRYVNKEKVERLKLHPGDILIEISGGSKDQPTGRILFWDRKENFPVIFSNFVKKIILNTQIVDPKYFFRYWQFLYLKGITKNYEERTTNIRNFKLSEFLENEKIPLPPLHIQQKIVKILDIIQSAVEIQDKIIEKTKELKRSLMAKLFREGAPSFSKGRKLKKTEIGEIPEDWEVVRLGEVVNNLTNGFPEGERDEMGILQLRMDSITSDGKINLNAGVKIPRKKGLEVYLLREGDILFNNTNSIDLVGKTALYKGEFKECVFSNHITRIRVNFHKTLPEWIFYILFRYWELKLFKNLAIRRVGQADISRNTLQNLKIPLPSLPEQREIADILQTIDQKIEIEQKKKELYEELFKTMLNKIMNQEIDINLLDIDEFKI